jgi:ABC-type molybdate transport system substrate-binding protein
LQAIPGNKDDDLRLFYADGRVLDGSQALAHMNADAALTMWIAGNQFFAMEDVIHRFQKADPTVGNVAVITLPPGLILQAILADGWRYGDKDYPMQPDLYASVNLAQLQTLRDKGRMARYMTYVRNQLEIVVATGNPKHIRGIDDLVRPGLRVMLPNPVTEGIEKFYIEPVLVRHGIWDKLTGGQQCKSCQATPTTYFTSVHHREIPAALKAGTTDAGIVWASEVGYARKMGVPDQGVPLPPQDSLVHEVAYAIGPLTGAAHPKAANAYLKFLASKAGQDVYARYGFIRATKADLRIRPIPAATK